ncbi:MAG TPA: maltose alpha-D-glucosyltransferase [Thermomicrobiaceae bacterium]|nr:maltose alpha-D-glucosyltransferase [Thermomicrobiaceae bacterium]
MAARERGGVPLEHDPLWYKDAILYEVHVRAFFDSNADGIGDFGGLVQKLDYLRDLGVTAIWVLPFYPSPLRDDGYDIADYEEVHPSYGTLRDFRQFVREAHRRGLRVITELVCNHTSDQHPWFQRARTARPGSSARDWYVWSNTPARYQDARIIFKDFERSNWTWDPDANAYFWHRFYSHQPDLNFDNPRVRQAMFRVLDFWAEVGVDGFRLDAVPYLYEREGTNCENLPETHTYLKELRRHIDEHYADRMLLAEANQWPEESVTYFGHGDECNMAFQFPLMPRMFMALRMEDRFPIIDILTQTPPIPDSSQWALFLRNHDELTLEMVTDDERDYMYRVYANDPQMRINLGIRRRLAPLLGNNRRRIELMNGLLFSLPGTPVIYYGDEIGMGDNIYLGDRDSVRTPMQWSADRNAGFSDASRQRLYLPVIVDAEYHYEAVNVEAQQNNPYSLLWWMKRLITLRKRYRAFGRGSLEFLFPENGKVLAFIRRYEDETVLVVANLSRFVQGVEIDLSEFRGSVPVEMFGHVEFPPIGEHPYFITLGPHSFYWFTIEPARVSGDLIEVSGPAARVPQLTGVARWEELFVGKGRDRLARVLPAYLESRRWFGGKARRIKAAQVDDAIPIPFDARTGFLVVSSVDYTEGDPERYLILAVGSSGERGEDVLHDSPHAILAMARLDSGEEVVIHDALTEPGFASALLSVVIGRKHLRGAVGDLVGTRTAVMRHTLSGVTGPLPASVVNVEQSNTSVVFGEHLFLKLFRKLEPGQNPDLEISQYLTERGFANLPALAGWLEYRGPGGGTAVAALQRLVANEGDAWRFTLDALGRYFERVLTEPSPEAPTSLAAADLLTLAADDEPETAHVLLNGYLSSARLLGQRTAELHRVLAASDRPDFAPEPFTSFYQRAVYQSMRVLTTNVFQRLRSRLRQLPEEARPDADEVLAAQDEVMRRFHSVIDRRIEAVRTRIHGDYHLGQVLFTGNDFVIIDFEGEPARPLSERRRKRSPLVDVAGMLRSFEYAVHAALIHLEAQGMIRPADVQTLAPAARYWELWVSVAFLRGYLGTVQDAPFLPRDPDDLALLLDAFRLEKAVYEVGYELNNRPDWVGVPLSGILELVRPGVTVSTSV